MLRKGVPGYLSGPITWLDSDAKLGKPKARAVPAAAGQHTLLGLCVLPYFPLFRTAQGKCAPKSKYVWPVLQGSEQAAGTLNTLTVELLALVPNQLCIHLRWTQTLYGHDNKPVGQFSIS